MESHRALLNVVRKWGNVSSILRNRTEDQRPGIRTGLVKLQNFCHFPVLVILGHPFPVFLENKGASLYIVSSWAARKWEFEEVQASEGEKGSPSSTAKKERTWHSSQPEEKTS